MTKESEQPAAGDIDLAGTAGERAEESVERERDAVGDEPDVGGVVSPDNAQSSH